MVFGARRMSKVLHCHCPPEFVTEKSLRNRTRDVDPLVRVACRAEVYNALHPLESILSTDSIVSELFSPGGRRCPSS